MDLREKFVKYFEEQDHVYLPSAPVIPENDPTVLFNTAGMQPLVPYLKGEKHPLGKRLVNYQKCIRLTDLDLVGDSTHHTFFEMLGNWSLGDYFKEKSIKYSFDFLTRILKIDPNYLAVSIFKGNDFVFKDIESEKEWLKQGIKKERIVYLGEEDNWWPNMESYGPCGPDTEIFYWRSKDEVPINFDPYDSRWVEIWNNVFMEYNHNENGTYTELKSKNVDTGMGYERMVTILEGLEDNYKSSVFKNIIAEICKISNLNYDDPKYTKSMRIIADHIRTAVFIIADDSLIKPSNTDQGYILRRLIRRAIRYANILNIDINSDWDIKLANIVIDQYCPYYEELSRNASVVQEVLINEKVKFNRTLEKGLREWNKIIGQLSDNKINKDIAFKLYDTYGFPIELTIELAYEHGFKVDEKGFYDKFKEHQLISKVGAKQKFQGGLSSTSDVNIKYHTATHLLNAALKKVLDSSVHQRGSNINEERMRFDFSWHQKVTEEQLKQIENLVNEYIQAKIPIIKKEMSKEEALKLGAEAMFYKQYADTVSVYQIGDISMELCGGPHVTNTSELGTFKIIKEEASSSGVRRIKAILK